MRYHSLLLLFIGMLALAASNGCDTASPPPAAAPVSSTILPARYIDALNDPHPTRYITLPYQQEQRTHPALHGETLPPWHMTVPSQGGTLNFATGIARSESRHRSVQAEFQIDLLESERSTPIWSSTITLPGKRYGIWHPQRLDLSAYAGRAITLRFRSKNKGFFPPPMTHWWGNPTVIPKTALPLKHPPIILISCDTLRVDHVGCYGHTRPTTPQLDRFAQDAVRFTRAYSNESWTLTAHMSMLTGLLPKHHGVTPSLNLPHSIATLPQLLQQHGYFTAGVTGHQWWLMASRGYERGFDLYSTPRSFRDVFEIHDLALDTWLPTHTGKPTFLFLHNYDIHDRFHDLGTYYDPGEDRFRQFTQDLDRPTPRLQTTANGESIDLLAAHNQGHTQLTAEEQQYMILAYDECVLKVDAALGQAFDRLKQMPWPGTPSDSYYDHALIIVTSDHGESLGEHGAQRHANIYEENIHIPLLIKFPQQRFAGSVADALVELPDLMPTILDTAALPIPEGLDGSSLLPLLEGKAFPEKAIYAQRAHWRSVRTQQDKLLHSLEENRYERYLLTADAEEHHNLFGKQPEQDAPLQQDLQAHFAPVMKGWHIQLHDPDGSLHAEFTLSSDGLIDAVHSVQGQFLEFTQQRGRNERKQLGGYIQLRPEQPNAHFIVNTVAEDATLTLQVRASKAMRCAEVKDSATQRQFTLQLDPRTAAAAPIPDTTHPTLTVWYQATPPQGDKADPLSEQALEELEALGYLEELQP